MANGFAGPPTVVGGDRAKIAGISHRVVLIPDENGLTTAIRIGITIWRSRLQLIIPPMSMSRLVISFAILLPFAATAAAESEFDQVAAVFSTHCVRCHNENNSKGDFSLATREAFAESGMAEAGDAESHLLTVISGPHRTMPKEGDPLSDTEVDTIRRWILAGANWPDGTKIEEVSKADHTWWSLQPLSEPNSDASVDRFIDAKLAESNLKRNARANKRDLIRRATYDLTGLPPTPNEIKSFLKDNEPDAYERLVDRLLESPRYGERWGRHWLDVVRFGESNGFERNVLINELWPFRDYVIKSLNDDKPFDQLIREHLAGDVIDPGNPDVEIGSAFLVAGPYDNVGNQDAAAKAQIRANTIDEMIRATSSAFLGMTVGCARCHNHKFDPIAQSDYYKLYATFAGTHHGNRPIATASQRKARNEKLAPLNKEKDLLVKQRKEIDKAINARIKENRGKYEAKWTRPAVDRTGTEEKIDPVQAKFVRLICDGLDTNPAAKSGFRIDEFQVWSTLDEPKNVALLSSGAKATGKSRINEEFPDAYAAHIAIDGETGARFISMGNDLTIELAEPTEIDRIVFSSAKGERIPEHRKFVFVSEYRIEVSIDGKTWLEVANGSDRKPANENVAGHRLRKIETTPEDQKAYAEIDTKIRNIDKQIRAVPGFRNVWVGNHKPADVLRTFHVFVGGSPQREGDEVTLASMSMVPNTGPSYELTNEATESQRRQALADWLASSEHPLTARVMANRLWHYHFGTGIVNTPNDFGYMGGRPSHPKLLDFLATKLIQNGWRLKPIHRLIMTSETYMQSSEFDSVAARIDGDARMLWRYPPRRLSAEEIRDSVLMISGKLNTKMGGPGFKLYRYLQDNVATYHPLDKHGPETYRRAVYHQNARASRTDLMTDFDQPDCAFSTARRANTTTPLQALTMLNHSFTLDMADALAQRLRGHSKVAAEQVDFAFQLAFGRVPTKEESFQCARVIDAHSLKAFCRVLLNTSEMIYVR